jgi:molecular chaperone GrpE
MTDDPSEDGPGSLPDAAARRARDTDGQRIEDLEAEVARLKDQLLRALAEQENMRRRAQREREDAVRFAAAELVRDLLTTADNLRRAIESLPADRMDAAAKHLLGGVEATERGLLEAFRKHGIERIDPLGEPFDPHRHQAMYQRADRQHPPGTVIEVIQPGYVYRDRLLRPAMVGVAGEEPAALAEAHPAARRSAR